MKKFKFLPFIVLKIWLSSFSLISFANEDVYKPFAMLYAHQSKTSKTLLMDHKDLDQQFPQDYVLETKKIEIPGFPYAFNASIIPWETGYMMSFRSIPFENLSFFSEIGIVLLDKEFNPIGKPQLLKLRENLPLIPCRAEDARLININNKIYMIYSDNVDINITRGGFRVFLAELEYKNNSFIVKNPKCLSCFDGESKHRREKNWVPFEYKHKLYLAYSLLPHKIFLPNHKTGVCQTVKENTSNIKWEWGELRGGTQAYLISDNEYLAFFHSSKNMSSNYSQGKEMPHYFMGAYIFAKDSFVITHISPFPIIHEKFYHGNSYKYFWKESKIIFPCGQVIDEKYIWLSYGREDHEIWIAKLDKEKLLRTLKKI